MADVIKLLPDAVANQIAAGEVVQRPASVVKELLENAIDAGAKSIDLIFKESGKTLIQVIDDGKGMTVADARMAFERHATSKINSAEDLFAIKSFGFRGEALSSIASVARVSLKTRQAGMDAGIEVVNEGSKFISQDFCAMPVGTNIAVKDIFFNIPARRQFLKSNNVEMNHIWEEIYRVAIPNYNINFKIFDGNKSLATYTESNLQQRIVSVFGKNYQQKLLSFAQDTDYVKIHGFVIKPEYSKKTRGEQYLFVNNRFIRSAYINAAIRNAFSGLISSDSFPGYFIFIEINPAEIDINIHPTKTEIKFRDEKMVAAVIASSIRKSLGTNNMMPSIDFESETTIDFTLDPNRAVKIPQIKVDPNFNPFKRSSHSIGSASKNNSINRWENISVEKNISAESSIPVLENTLIETNAYESSENYIQIGRRYIVSNVKSGLLLVDQHAASMRILFDKLKSKNQTSSNNSHMLMFPETINLSATDAHLMSEISDELNKCGFVISYLGKEMFSVSAVPENIDLRGSKINQILESVLEDYKYSGIVKNNKNDAVILSMARKLSLKHGDFLNREMMQLLISELFASSNPEIAPDGKKIYSIVNVDDLSKWL